MAADLTVEQNAEIRQAFEETAAALTVFSRQASDVATTPGLAIDMERNAAVALAVQLIVDGKPGRAQYELARSVVRQGRIAGLGTQRIEPVCPCGGRRCP